MGRNSLPSGLTWPPLWVAVCVFIGSYLLSLVAALLLFPAFHPEPGQSPATTWIVAVDLATHLALAVLSARAILVRNPSRLPAAGTYAADPASPDVEARSAAVAFLTRVQRSDLELAARALLFLAPVVGLLMWVQTRTGFVMTLEDWQIEVLAHPLVLVSTFTLVPVAEELFFRGVLYGSLEKWGYRTAFLGTVAVSALVHWPLPHVVGALPGMVAFTWLRRRTGRLAPPVIAHALYNFLLVGGALVVGALLG